MKIIKNIITTIFVNSKFNSNRRITNKFLFMGFFYLLFIKIPDYLKIKDHFNQNNKNNKRWILGKFDI